ncbi:hypothetical protein CXG81DRAFT_14883 [Caulochytrium protostelioides]|uniref:Inositol polyphosphate-related phosphatase domain-containing protein n=1 Tax=Caulochytrium protostelioides TaxID=1555241 RepID=A0A4P9X263_9FUNG|nr:hypothetical protein CXG81DRAFT_14883 [Caulochytrium protostelioides]|eukprot:RKO99173.1 hypothetical protein CXG81DRAFT_14883 [Caulochytrium protostelioides]
MTAQIPLSHGQANDSRIASLQFVPQRVPEDEGRYLWVGMERGEILLIDCEAGAILNRRTVHAGAVCQMLRHHDDLWTIDDAGGIRRWINGDLSGQPLSFRVQPNIRAAVVARDNVWTAGGTMRTALEVYHPMHPSMTAAAALCTSPYRSLVFSGHEDGVVVVYNADTVTRLYTVNLPRYRITSVQIILDNLWVAYSTGKISVYEVGAHYPDPAAAATTTASGSRPRLFLVAMAEHSPSASSTTGRFQILDGFLGVSLMSQLMASRVSFCAQERPLRFYVASWNVDSRKPTEAGLGFLEQWLGALERPDMIVVGMQELVNLESKSLTARQLLMGSSRKLANTVAAPDQRQKLLWQVAIANAIEAVHGPGWEMICTHAMVGLCSFLAVSPATLPRVRNVHSCLVKTGMGGYHGNKGAVVMRVLIDDTSFCFVNCHLAAHQAQAHDGLLTSELSADDALPSDAAGDPLPYDGVGSSSAGGGLIFAHGADGSRILDHEYVVWSGDMNYRVDGENGAVRRAVAMGQYGPLLAHDQLQQQRENPWFLLSESRGWREGPIAFAPTFKYDRGSNTYDTSDKHRIPAWCDRAVARMQQLFYRRFESTMSDHRPVGAGFTCTVKVVDAAAANAERRRCEDWIAAYQTRIARRCRVAWLAQALARMGPDAAASLAAAGTASTATAAEREALASEALTRHRDHLRSARAWLESATESPAAGLTAAAHPAPTPPPPTGASC